MEELAASIFPDWTRSNSRVFAGPAGTRDGFNGWQVTTMVTNRGAGVRMLVLADGLPAASGNSR